MTGERSNYAEYANGKAGKIRIQCGPIRHSSGFGMNCQANGLEPYAYLRHLFTELPKAETVEAIEALLPGNLRKVG